MNETTYYQKNKEKLLLYQKEYNLKNKDRYKTQYQKNKKKRLIYQKEYSLKNKETRKNYQQIYRNKNKEYFRIYRENNRENNKNTMKRYYNNNKFKKKLYIKNRREVNINFKMSGNLRVRLNCAIKNNQKVGSAVRDLGCSIEEFKKYIESKFECGMTWENYGKWHLDHITPLSWFNLENRNQFLVACHYTNYQPLWAEDNLSKSNK